MGLPDKETAALKDHQMTNVLSKNEDIETRLDVALGELIIEMRNCSRIFEGASVFTSDPLFVLSSMLYQDAMFDLASNNYQVPVCTYSAPSQTESNTVASFCKNHPFLYIFSCNLLINVEKL